MSDSSKTARLLVDKALKAGAQEAEAFVQDGRQVQVSVNAGQSRSFAKPIRAWRTAGLRGPQARFVYSSDFRTAALADLAQRAVTLARFGLADEHAGLPGSDWLARATIPRSNSIEASNRRCRPRRESPWLWRWRRRRSCRPAHQANPRDAAFEAPPDRPRCRVTRADVDYASTSVSVFVTALAADGVATTRLGRGRHRAHLSEIADPEQMGTKAGHEALRRLGRGRWIAAGAGGDASRHGGGLARSRLRRVFGRRGDQEDLICTTSSARRSPLQGSPA